MPLDGKSKCTLHGMHPSDPTACTCFSPVHSVLLIAAGQLLHAGTQILLEQRVITNFNVMF